MSTGRIKRVSIHDRRAGPVNSSKGSVKNLELRLRKGKPRRNRAYHQGREHDSSTDPELLHQASRSVGDRRIVMRDRVRLHESSASRNRRLSPRRRHRTPPRLSMTSRGERSAPVWEVNPLINNSSVPSGVQSFNNADQLVRAVQLPASSVGGGLTDQTPYYVVIPAETLPAAQLHAQQAALPFPLLTHVAENQQTLNSHFPSGRSERETFEIETQRAHSSRRGEYFAEEQFGSATSRHDAVRRHEEKLSNRVYRGVSPVGQDAILRVPYCKACHEYIGREKDLEEHLKSEKHFNNYYSLERRDFNTENPSRSTANEVERAADADFHTSTSSRSLGDRMESRHDHYGRDDCSRRDKSTPRPLLSLSREEVEPKSGAVYRQSNSSRLESRELPPSRRVNWDDASYSPLSYKDEHRSRDQDYRKPASASFAASKSVSKDWGRVEKEKEQEDYGQLFEDVRYPRSTYDTDSHMRVSQYDYR